jgi:hypothetical protein
MLYVYLIEAHAYGYDDYIGFVIAARNESEVRNLAASKDHRNKRTWLCKSDVTKVGIADTLAPTIILDSFNAG